MPFACGLCQVHCHLKIESIWSQRTEVEGSNSRDDLEHTQCTCIDMSDMLNDIGSTIRGLCKAPSCPYTAEPNSNANKQDSKHFLLILACHATSSSMAPRAVRQCLQHSVRTSYPLQLIAAIAFLSTVVLSLTEVGLTPQYISH